MSNLQTLARKKSEATMQRRIEAIPIQFKTINNEHASKGLLRSGATLKRCLLVCKEALVAQAKAVQIEYLWAAKTAIFASQTWINQLTTDAVDSLELLHQEEIKELKKAVLLVGAPEQLDYLLTELNRTRNSVNNDISLALRSYFAERSRGLVKSAFGLISRSISRVLHGM